MSWHFQGNAETPSSPRPDRERFASYSHVHGSSFAPPHSQQASFPASKLVSGKGNDGTLQLSQANRANAGTYFCEFTLFPIGKNILLVEMELQVMGEGFECFFLFCLKSICFFRFGWILMDATLVHSSVDPGTKLMWEWKQATGYVIATAVTPAHVAAEHM